MEIREVVSKLRMLDVAESAEMISAIEALDRRAVEAEIRVSGFERQAKLGEIAAAVGIEPAVLEKLLGDRLEQIKIQNGLVYLGGKSLSQAVEADEKLRHFKALLFPNQSAESSAKPDIVTEYMKRTYAQPSTQTDNNA